MGAILLPAQCRQQPQQVSQPDRGNPLSKSLAELFLPNAGKVLALSSGATFQPLLSAGSPTISAGLQGIQGNYNGSSYHYKNDANAAGVNEITLLAALTPAAIGTTASEAFSFGNSGNDIPLLMLGQGATGGQLEFRIRDSGGNDLSVAAYDAQWADGKPAVILGTRSSSGNFFNLWINGRKIATSTAAPLAATLFDRSALGCLLRGGGALTWFGSISLAAAFNRGFTDAEARSITLNPWQLFRGQARRLWAASSGAGAFFASITESIAAVESGVAALSAIGSITDSVAAVDDAIAALTTLANVAENAVASDSAGGNLSAAAFAAETSAALDSSAGSLSAAVSVSEGMSISDAGAAVMATAANIAESTAITETIAATAAGNFASTATEVATALAAASAAMAANAIQVEAASLADAATAQMAATAAIAETVSISEFIGATTTGQYLASILETVAATESASVAASFIASIMENAAASDSYAPRLGCFAQVTESATAFDISAAMLNRIVDIAPERVLRINGEQRVLTINAEKRVLRINAEQRIWGR